MLFTGLCISISFNLITEPCTLNNDTTEVLSALNLPGCPDQVPACEELGVRMCCVVLTLNSTPAQLENFFSIEMVECRTNQCWQISILTLHQIYKKHYHELKKLPGENNALWIQCLQVCPLGLPQVQTYAGINTTFSIYKIAVETIMRARQLRSFSIAWMRGRVHSRQVHIVVDIANMVTVCNVVLPWSHMACCQCKCKQKRMCSNTPYTTTVWPINLSQNIGVLQSVDSSVMSARQGVCLYTEHCSCGHAYTCARERMHATWVFAFMRVSVWCVCVHECVCVRARVCMMYGL